MAKNYDSSELFSKGLSIEQIKIVYEFLSCFTIESVYDILTAMEVQLQYPIEESTKVVDYFMENIFRMVSNKISNE